MTDRELMQQALKALDGVEALLTSMDVTHLLIYGDVDNAITALRERLAQPDVDPCKDGSCDCCWTDKPEQEDLNLSCKSVQARLASLWGYVKAQPQHPECDHEERIPMLACTKCGALVGTQPEQEAVGEVVCIEFHEEFGPEAIVALHQDVELGVKLYTTPPQRKPLTDEQAEAAFKAWHYKHGNNTQGIKWVDDLLRSCWKAAIEAAHDIKENT